ncbi:MAG TPA: Jag N-terminal domain-containing protein, partial [Chloroflexota bacterium]|nr:Jag N-terminal domain-containing protein [Chloroflexota bacterium]
MESLEVTARTVSEAIEKALSKLGKTREEVDISILSEGSRGILGIGGEDARILVSPREAPETVKTAAPATGTPSGGEFAETARVVLENLLGGMRITAEVEVSP